MTSKYSEHNNDLKTIVNLNIIQEMDKQINYLEKITTITDLISQLEGELSKTSISDEKATEIKGYLDNNKMDYHSLQAIMNIMASIPEVNRNEKLKSILSQLSF